MNSPHPPTASNSLPPESPAEKSSRLLWWLHPKVALPLLLLGLLLLSPLLFRAYRIASVPDIGEPFDVEAFGTVDIPPDENAMTQYAKAAALIINGTFPSEDLDKALEGDWEQTSEPVRKWLDDNQPALAEWKKGTERALAVVVPPKDTTIETSLELVESLRELNRLSRLQVEHLRFQNDLEAAKDWLNAALRASRHLGQNGGLIERLTGIACRVSLTGTLDRWAADSRTGEHLLRMALREFESADAITPAFSMALRCEYLMWRNTLKMNREAALYEYWPETYERYGKGGAFVLGESEFSERLVALVFQNWLEHADTPGWKRPPRMTLWQIYDAPSGMKDRVTSAAIVRHLNSDSLGRRFLAVYANAESSFLREAARRAVTPIMLSCHLYYRMHGDWPGKLEDLVPDLLPELPLDPCGTGSETIRLKRDGEDAIVYSLGTNGTDDGGEIDYDSTNLGDFPDIGSRLKKPK